MSKYKQIFTYEDPHASDVHYKLQEENIKKLREKTDTPAISLAVVAQGEISQEIAQGKTNILNSTNDVTVNTVFEAASLSKVVFAYLVLKLEQHKILNLTQPLAEILPHERLIGHPYWQDVTTWHVLSHQTGLPGMNFGPDREFKFHFKPGEGYAYSGVAYIYLQKVIEHLTGLSLEQLAKKYVFDPIGMHHSSFLRLKKFQFALGHTVSNEVVDKGPGFTEDDTQSQDFASAPVSLHTTAHDYALFMIRWLQDTTLHKAFHPAVFMDRDQWAQAERVSAHDLQQLAWGLGWLLLFINGQTIAAHWGDVGESKSFVFINVQTQQGVVCFTNSHNGLSIARDIVTQALEINVNPLFNYLFQKFGYEHHDAPDWKVKQYMQTWHMFAIHELHDKTQWLTNAQKKNILFITNDVESCTLTIKYDPKQLLLFIKIIRNELNYFKYLNQMKDSDCIIIEENGHHQFMSLSITITKQDQYHAFITTLHTMELLPELKNTIQEKVTYHSQHSLFKPSSTQQLTIEHKLMPKSTSWWQQELTEKKEFLLAFWQQRVVQLNQNSIDEFKKHVINIHFPKDVAWQKRIEQLFDDAASLKINFEQFFAELKHLPMIHIREMAKMEKLILPQPTKTLEEKSTIEASDLINIQRYMLEKGITGSIAFGFAQQTIIAPNYSLTSTSTYAMHSVGKVFTGILMFIMIRKDVLSEENLTQPLNEDFIKSLTLPHCIKEHLLTNKVTLYQLMTHTAGLGNYLTKYFAAISSGNPPEMKKLEDFLPFVEETTSPIDEWRYSNDGLLLVGLAIQYAYNEKYDVAYEYHEILEKHIISQVGMPSFSATRPEHNAQFNSADPIAPHVQASSAGGYWVNAEDLAKFGQWLYNTCQPQHDPELLRLIQSYGQEFYNKTYNMIVHAGIMGSSSAFLSVSFNTGAVIATLSNQPDMAIELNSTIQAHVFAKPQEAREIQEDETLPSFKHDG